MNKTFTILSKNTYRFLFIVILIGFGSTSYATNHRVGCENFIFVPDSFNANVGDTVTWYYINGVEHEPTSLVIPAGASSWQHIISPADTSFSYVITSNTLGTYNYECSFHTAEGMFGKFTVVGPSSVAPVETDRQIKVYPMPFQHNLNIDLGNNSLFKNGTTIEISNIIGQRKFRLDLNETQSAPLSIDLSDLESGIYFMTVSAGSTKRTIRLIKSER